MLADGGGRVKVKNATHKRNWHYMPPPPPQPPLLPTHACSWPVLDPFPTSNGHFRPILGPFRTPASSALAPPDSRPSKSGEVGFRLAQRPVGLRRRRSRSSEWLPSRHAPQMALPARERHRGQRGSRREGNHPGTGGPSRRPPAAGCADQRSAFQAVPAIFRRRLYALGGLPAATQCSISQRSGQSPAGIRTSTDREPAAKPVAGSRNRLPLASRHSARPWP